MVLGEFFCRFTGSAAQTNCARRPQLVSKKFSREQIFVGTNFRELAFDRENRENFCLAKISRYTVFKQMSPLHFCLKVVCKKGGACFRELMVKHVQCTCQLAKTGICMQAISYLTTYVCTYTFLLPRL